MAHLTFPTAYSTKLSWKWCKTIHLFLYINQADSVMPIRTDLTDWVYKHFSGLFFPLVSIWLVVNFVFSMLIYRFFSPAVPLVVRPSDSNCEVGRLAAVRRTDKCCSEQQVNQTAYNVATSKRKKSLPEKEPNKNFHYEDIVKWNQDWQQWILLLKNHSKIKILKWGR